MNCDYKTQNETKIKRRKKRKVKNKLADSFKHAEGEKYSSGKFH